MMQTMGQMRQLLRHYPFAGQIAAGVEQEGKNKTGPAPRVKSGCGHSPVQEMCGFICKKKLNCIFIGKQEGTCMDVKMKNISKAEVLVLKEQISYQEGQVVSKTLAQNSALSITLFSFAKGEEISTHESSGDAFVTCLDGVGKVTIDGVDHLLHEGECIVMPAGHPHAVYGEERFKMLLVVIF